MSNQKKPGGNSNTPAGKPRFVPFQVDEALSEYNLVTFENQDFFLAAMVALRQEGPDGIAVSELFLRNAKRNEQTDEICVLLFRFAAPAPAGLEALGVKVERVYRTAREVIEWGGAAV